MESDVMCTRLPLERLSVKCRDLSTVSHKGLFLTFLFHRYCAPSSMKGVEMTITALLALLLKVLNSPALIAGLIAFLQKYLQL
jgi:hypothetical protein